jgi:hypothetical protein
MAKGEKPSSSKIKTQKNRIKQWVHDDDNEEEQVFS